MEENSIVHFSAPPRESILASGTGWKDGVRGTPYAVAPPIHPSTIQGLISDCPWTGNALDLCGFVLTPNLGICMIAKQLMRSESSRPIRRIRP